MGKKKKAKKRKAFAGKFAAALEAAERDEKITRESVEKGWANLLASRADVPDVADFDVGVFMLLDSPESLRTAPPGFIKVVVGLAGLAACEAQAREQEAREYRFDDGQG